MKTKTAENILSILAARSAKSPGALARELGISTQALHRQLTKLVAAGKIEKLGKAPKVFYKLASKIRKVDLSKLSQNEKDYLEKNFSELRATGQLERGLSAFRQWLLRTRQEKSYVTLAQKYRKQREEADRFRDSYGFIDLLPKIQATFDACSLDKAACLDFYSLPQFGKTFLGNLLTAAKSGQDNKSFEELAKIFEPSLQQFCDVFSVDSLCWVPHSIPRKLMVLDQLRLRCHMNVPEFKASKVFAGSIPVAQKSLAKLQDRIDNARETLFVTGNRNRKYSRVLLIDDALGSGATVNELARKIKNEFLVDHVFALVLVGSFKGFDVMSVI